MVGLLTTSFACTTRPLSPSGLAIAPDIRGAWSASVIETACQRSSGSGASTCKYTLEREADLTIDLQQDANQVSGVLLLDFGAATILTGDVFGRVDSAGSVVLEGILILAEEPDAETVEVRNWSTTFDRSTNTMSGRFTLTFRFTNYFGPQVYDETFDIQQAELGAP